MPHWYIANKFKKIGWKAQGFNRELGKNVIKKMWSNSGKKRVPDLYHFGEDGESLYLIEVRYSNEIDFNKIRDYAEFAFNWADLNLDGYALLIEIDVQKNILGIYDLLSLWNSMVKESKNNLSKKEFIFFLNENDIKEEIFNNNDELNDLKKLLKI